MEEQKSGYKRGKKKANLSFGGGGIGGVVVWGGALAVAALITLFATKASRKRDANKAPRTPSGACKESKNSCCKKEDEGSEGLRFILQTSSPSVHQNPRFTSHGISQVGVTQIDSCKLHVQEEKPTTKIINEEKPYRSYKEILLSNVSKPEIITMHKDYGIVEEFSLPMIEKPSLFEDSMKRNGFKGDPASTESIAGKTEDEASETDHAEQMSVAERNITMPSVEEEEGGDEYNDDDDKEDQKEEYVVEKGEDSSEGTGDSSMESNAEAIWPSELTEGFSLDLKAMNTSFQNSQEKIEDEEKAAKIEAHGYFNSSNNDNAEKSVILSRKGAQELLMADDQPVYTRKSRIWIWTILVILLLLLLLSLAHQNAISYYLLTRHSFIVL